MNQQEKILAAIVISITLMREMARDGTPTVGTFTDLFSQDSVGDREIKKADSLKAIHELLAAYGVTLPSEYVVTNYVAWALRGTKKRHSALEGFDKVVSLGEPGPATHAPAKATFVTGTIVDSSPVAQPDQSDAAVRREAATFMASMYRLVTTHNSKTNATPEVREANLAQKVPGTSITYKRLAQLARAIDPSYNV